MIYAYKSQFAVSFKKFSTSAIACVMLLNITGCGGKEKAQEPQAIAVKLKTLESATLVDSSEYVGNLEATDRVALAPRTEGRILRIFARQGDRVSQGEPLVELDPTQEQEEVNAATQNVNVEKARLGQVQAELSTAEAQQARIPKGSSHLVRKARSISADYCHLYLGGTRFCLYSQGKSRYSEFKPG